MKWRYGIVKYRHKQNERIRFYGIGELFYDTDPLKVYACTQEPVEVYTDADAESEEEIRESITWQLNAVLKDITQFPVFDADGPFEKYPINENEEEWVELTEEKMNELFGKEGHKEEVADEGLQDYIKSMQEEQNE